jgi:hypothetical protein
MMCVYLSICVFIFLSLVWVGSVLCVLSVGSFPFALSPPFPLPSFPLLSPPFPSFPLLSVSVSSPSPSLPCLARVRFGEIRVRLR